MMNKHNKKYVLSIGGFDPSGGAGLLADNKTIERIGGYGIHAISALTYQNHNSFEQVEWLDADKIIRAIKLLNEEYDYEVVKIGLIQNLDVLNYIVDYLGNKYKIIWDPIVKASAGFEFHKVINQTELTTLLQKIYLICPNIDEAKFLASKENLKDCASMLSSLCNVLLTGGHNKESIGTDTLYTLRGDKIDIHNSNPNATDKHGSGCVLSSAIATFLSNGDTLLDACKNAKNYTSNYLASHPSLIGYHAEHIFH